MKKVLNLLIILIITLTLSACVYADDDERNFTVLMMRDFNYMRQELPPTIVKDFELLSEISTNWSHYVYNSDGVLQKTYVFGEVIENLSADFFCDNFLLMIAFTTPHIASNFHVENVAIVGDVLVIEYDFLTGPFTAIGTMFVVISIPREESIRITALEFNQSDILYDFIPNQIRLYTTLSVKQIMAELGDIEVTKIDYYQFRNTVMELHFANPSHAIAKAAVYRLSQVEGIILVELISNGFSRWCLKSFWGSR